MTFVFEVLVTLKPGLSDPQGKAVEGALPAARVDQRARRARGQAHRALSVDAADEARRVRRSTRWPSRLLSNPVIEDFRILETEEA